MPTAFADGVKKYNSFMRIEGGMGLHDVAMVREATSALHVMLAMLFDAILYGVVGWYVRNVRTGTDECGAAVKIFAVF